MRPTIFISYVRGDAAAAQAAIELRDALGAEAEAVLGLAAPSAPGAGARRWIDGRVAEAQLFVLILGPSWAGHVAAHGERGTLFAELAAALARPRNVLPMYTALVGGAQAPTRGALPDALQSLIDTPLAPSAAPSGVALGPDADARGAPGAPGAAVSGLIAALRPEIARLRAEAAVWDDGDEERLIEPEAPIAPEAPGYPSAAPAEPAPDGDVDFERAISAGLPDDLPRTSGEAAEAPGEDGRAERAAAPPDQLERLRRWEAAQQSDAAPVAGSALGAPFGDAEAAVIGAGAGFAPDAPQPMTPEPMTPAPALSWADAPPDAFPKRAAEKSGAFEDAVSEHAPLDDPFVVDERNARAIDIGPDDDLAQRDVSLSEDPFASTGADAPASDDADDVGRIVGKVPPRTYGLGREPQKAAALLDAANVSAAAPGAQRGLSAAPALRPAMRDPDAAAERLRSAPAGLFGAWMAAAAAGAAAMGRLAGAGPKAASRTSDAAEPAEPIIAAPGVDPAGEPVRASLFAPRRARPGTSFRAQLYLHLAEQIEAARAEVAEFNPSAARQSGAALSTLVRRGAEVTVHIAATDAEGRRAMRVDPAVSAVVWRGEPVSADLFIHVSSEAAPRGYGFVAVVLLNGRPVGELAFLVEVEPAPASATAGGAVAMAGAAPFGAMGFAPADPDPSGWGPAESEASAPPSIAAAARSYQKIFFSYARADAERVRLVARGFELMDQDFFWDVESLRSGEIWRERLLAEIDRSDVFVLFWSAAARDSDMVRAEVAHALRREAERGAPRILPFPLEGPPPPAPWEEIADRHIGDAIYYRSVTAAERAGRSV